DEVTDVRLHRLFDHADGNKDGLVTREELIVLAAKLEAEIAEGGGPGARGRGAPRGGGPFGLPGGGPGGFGGPPPPGQVLNPFLQERLNMTPEQKKHLEELQKEVDERLGKIITEEQKKQLKDMREGGRGRFGGPWGRPPPRDQGGRENRRA